MNLRLITAVLAAALFATPTSLQANTLQVSDSQKLRALRIKLHTATADVTQALNAAVEFRNQSVGDCLGQIHQRASSVENTAAGAGSLVALGVMMADHSDEILVLRELRVWLTELTKELAFARQLINGTMSSCSTSATVNVKGQAVLNVLSELNDPIASLSRRVEQAIPPRQ